MDFKDDSRATHEMIRAETSDRSDVSLSLNVTVGKKMTTEKIKFADFCKINDPPLKVTFVSLIILLVKESEIILKSLFYSINKQNQTC